MKGNKFQGKTLAVILWGTDKNGEDEVFVYNTEFRKKEEEYTFEIPSNIYESDSNKITLLLNNDFLERLKPIAANMKETLSNADYSLSLSVGNLPSN